MTKPKKQAKGIAENHWNYNREIILLLDNSLLGENIRYLHLMEYFYIEAFVHGFKHGKDNKK